MRISDPSGGWCLRATAGLPSMGELQPACHFSRHKLLNADISPISQNKPPFGAAFLFFSRNRHRLVTGANFIFRAFDGVIDLAFTADKPTPQRRERWFCAGSFKRCCFLPGCRPEGATGPSRKWFTSSRTCSTMRERFRTTLQRAWAVDEE